MYVNVLVEIGVKNVDQYFIYHISKELQDHIKIGIRVLVPFGKQQVEGFVLDILKETNTPYEIKEVIRVVDMEPILNEEMLYLGQKIVNLTLCSKVSAFQTMLPKALKASHKSNIKIKLVKYFYPTDFDKIKEYLVKSKNKNVNYLMEQLSLPKILLDTINRSLISILVKKELGYVKEEEVNRFNSILRKVNTEYSLTKEQLNAKEQILASLNQDKVFLLHGVTGSGKTEVYMQVIDLVIRERKTAIMLVPEISLTPQIVNRFQNRFGEKIAVLHSGLTDGERYDEYRQIQEGQVQIVVGARSAIFAPLHNLGIIIMDEEHVTSYKQENHPKYHTRDIALLRGKYHHCPVILGSATPTLESYARAKKGVYQLITMSSRANNKPLPQVKLLNMKKCNHLLSDEIIALMQEKLDRQEQIMLLLNKRGYSSFLVCQNCGHPLKCPNCDISLTYHKSSDTLRCHYCGYGVKKTNTCQECHQDSLKELGFGIEKLEEEIMKYFKDAKIARMDTDVITKKGDYQRIINDFEDHQQDILIGTQMIAKGLDFPLVTLVGVINCDISLGIPDFRSGEYTFELLSQVAGRAGRKDNEGTVLIQGYNIDNYSIQYAAKHDYEGFYQTEMAIRKSLKYPPYYYLTKILITSKKYEVASLEAKKVTTYLRNKISNDVIVLGPSIAGILKINNIYRFQCLIKYKDNKALNPLLKELDELYKYKTNVNIEIDQNPIRI